MSQRKKSPLPELIAVGVSFLVITVAMIILLWGDTYCKQVGWLPVDEEEQARR